MNICVIPARGGSKRIPRKNIRDFCGKPMIAWSIEAARASRCFDRIMVSTDDDEIAQVARAWGAEVPFMRPAELAGDHADTTSVVVHALQRFQDTGQTPASVCCLYATAPLVSAEDLSRGLKLLSSVPLERFVFTAVPYRSAIQRALHIDADSGLSRMINPDKFGTRSQDLELAFHDAGQFYWGRPQAWLSASNIFDNSSTLILPTWRVLDIDTLEDWTHAELMHKALEDLRDRV